MVHELPNGHSTEQKVINIWVFYVEVRIRVLPNYFQQSYNLCRIQEHYWTQYHGNGVQERLLHLWRLILRFGMIAFTYFLSQSQNDGNGRVETIDKIFT